MTVLLAWLTHKNNYHIKFQRESFGQKFIQHIAVAKIIKTKLTMLRKKAAYREITPKGTNPDRQHSQAVGGLGKWLHKAANNPTRT